MINQLEIESIKNNIQKHISVLRKANDLTQEELADLCCMSVKSISDIETNRRGVSLMSLIKILHALNINLYDRIQINNDSEEKYNK